MNKELEFLSNLDKLISGMKLANRICSYDTSNCYIIINRHIGDSVRAFKTLLSIKNYYGNDDDLYHFNDEQTHKSVFKKKKLIKRIIVITTKSISGVAKLYSKYYDDLIVLSKDDLDALELYSYSGCSVHENIYYDENPSQIISKHYKTDEGSWVRTKMFGITDLMWSICLPQGLATGQICISDASKNAGHIFIKNHKIIPNKMVVLCPVAKNSSMLVNAIWEEFARKLKSKGYRVFTNAFGNEETVKNTERFEQDIDILVYLATLGIRIIGVQCGLMDILVKIKPEFVTVLHIIQTDKDRQYAFSRGANKEVNMVNGITRLRIEHFEEDYVLKLLMDNFH